MAQAKAEREKTNKIKEMERMDRSGDDDGEVSKKKEKKLSGRERVKQTTTHNFVCKKYIS